MTAPMNQKNNKINPAFGLLLALFITVVGMFAVYVAGNARGYDPSATILIRNTLMMSMFFVVYFILKSSYKGDFTILVVVALLTGIGFVVQYRISSAINTNFQDALIKQYSAAALKKATTDSTGAQMTHDQDSTVTRADERSLESIQTEAKQLLKLDEWQFSAMMRQFFAGVPGWTRLIVSYLIALFSIIFIIKKCEKEKFMQLLSRPFFWVAITVLLLIIFVGLSEVKTRGRFVYQMTPWEAFKITIIIFLSGYFALFKEELTKKKVVLKGKKLQSFLVTWGPFLLIWLIPQFLFIVLKDFGQVIIYGGLVIVMIFVVTRKYRFLFGGIAFIAISSKAILLLEGLVPSHALKRFQIWADIWALPHDSAWWDQVYQIMNSFFALHAGGFAGSGLGLGYPTNIPLIVSDFVYAAIAEEMGFIGAALIVLLYLLLFFLGIRVALRAKNDFEKLLATGFASMIAIQVFVNIGGVIKLIPLTGITLPFISRGGFSFLISFIIIGFLMGISHRNGLREEQIEH